MMKKSAFCIVDVQFRLHIRLYLYCTNWENPRTSCGCFKHAIYNQTFYSVLPVPDLL